MKTALVILICIGIVAVEITVIVAIFAPQVLLRPLRSLRDALRPRRRMRNPAGAH